MSCVYVARGTDSYCEKVLYKVGFTRDDSADRRVLTIRDSMIPFADVSLIKYWSFSTISDAKSSEGLFHLVLDDYRVHGEWFDLSDPTYGSNANSLRRAGRWLVGFKSGEDIIRFRDDLSSKSSDEFKDHVRRFIISDGPTEHDNFDGHSAGTPEMRDYEDYRSRNMAYVPLTERVSDYIAIGVPGRLLSTEIAYYLYNVGAISEINRVSLISIGIALRKLGVKRRRGGDGRWFYDNVGLIVK